ncbi:MAG: ComF family protein [Clostridia bacterium]|nr:ComF family protein [Clostridia bacterium]
MGVFTKVKEWLLNNNTAGFTCDGCGREVFEYPSQRLCEHCQKTVFKNEKRQCEKCGRALRAEGLCLGCKKEPPAFERAVSPFIYHGDAARMINRFKQGERYLAAFFAEEMAKKLSELSFLEPPILVAVPITERKKKTRRFNQAEDLAKRIAALTGYEYAADVLVKIGDGDQKKRTAQERRERIRGSIRVRKRKLCDNRVVIVVDDIMTTGATGGECARILKNAGARAVYFVTACSLPQREE